MPVTPKISIIVAIGRNRVIGRGGVLPWRMPSDLKTFRRLTLGKPVVMGRTTFQSIGRPLDGRDNIVVTRDRQFRAPGVEVAESLDQALAIARDRAVQRAVSEVMVIGGGQIYTAALTSADRIYLTLIEAEPEGDAHFPALDPRDWREVGREPIATSERDDHRATLVTYERIPR